LRETLAGKSRDYQDSMVVEKFRFQNIFRSHKNKKPALSNSSGLKSIFQKPRFRDGLVWTVGQLNRQIKLRFQISPG